MILADITKINEGIQKPQDGTLGHFEAAGNILEPCGTGYPGHAFQNLEGLSEGLIFFDSLAGWFLVFAYWHTMFILNQPRRGIEPRTCTLRVCRSTD